MTQQSGKSHPTGTRSRALAAAECWLGAAFLLIGASVVVLWRLSDPSNAPHGGLLLLASAPTFVFGGIALLVAGALLRRTDGWRWAGQALPLVLFILVFEAPEALAWATFMLAGLFAP